MRREEGRKGAERSREEAAAVGVFVCPRRLLSSHYQGIRQMLALYRCWFDSEPPTLIPSSLLLPTTPPQRLLSSSLYSCLCLHRHPSTPPPTPPHPTPPSRLFAKISRQNFSDSTFQLSPLLSSRTCTQRHTHTDAHTHKNTNTTITWFTASVNLSVH